MVLKLPAAIICRGIVGTGCTRCARPALSLVTRICDQSEAMDVLPEALMENTTKSPSPKRLRRPVTASKSTLWQCHAFILTAL